MDLKLKGKFILPICQTWNFIISLGEEARIYYLPSDELIFSILPSSKWDIKVNISIAHILGYFFAILKIYFQFFLLNM